MEILAFLQVNRRSLGCVGLRLARYSGSNTSWRSDKYPHSIGLVKMGNLKGAIILGFTGYCTCY